MISNDPRIGIVGVKSGRVRPAALFLCNPYFQRLQDFPTS